MSSPIFSPKDLVSNSYVTNDLISEESTEEKEKMEISTQNVLSISSYYPTSSTSIHNMCLQCFYVIVALNLEIKHFVKENYSLKDKLASKNGLIKARSSTCSSKPLIFNQNSAQNYFKKSNHESTTKNNKHCFSIKLPIQEKSSCSKQVLRLSAINTFPSTNLIENPKIQPVSTTIITSIFSKSHQIKEEKQNNFSFMSSFDSIKSEKFVPKYLASMDIRLQSVEEQKEASNDRKDDSHEKNKEKEQDQSQEQNHQKEKQKKEQLKLINNLSNNNKISNEIFSLSKVCEKVLQNNFQEADFIIKSKINALELKNENKDFLLYALQTSIISQIFNMRISNLDVLLLFIEVMKLALKSRQQQQLFRSEERLLQLSHMKEIVSSFKHQANSLLFSGLTSGLLAVVSGIAPIFGHIKGEWTLGHLSKVFSSLKTMESEKFFENASKITLATSEMAKATGQIQTAFSESHRAYDEHHKESYKIDADDRARTIEEIKDNWRSLENFLYQCLQMQHDTIKQLYQ